MQAIKQMAEKALSRIRNILSRGTLTGLAVVPPNKTTMTAVVTLFSQETYSGIEYPDQYGFSSFPPLDGNTEVIAGFFGGARDHGTVLKAFNRKAMANLPFLPLAQGEAALWNALTGSYVLMKADGSIHMKSTTSVSIDTPTLSCSGDIIDNVGTNSRTMAGMRAKYNSHTHGGAVGPPASGEQM